MKGKGKEKILIFLAFVRKKKEKIRFLSQHSSMFEFGGTEAPLNKPTGTAEVMFCLGHAP